MYYIRKPIFLANMVFKHNKKGKHGSLLANLQVQNDVYFSHICFQHLQSKVKATRHRDVNKVTVRRSNKKIFFFK